MPRTRLLQCFFVTAFCPLVLSAFCAEPGAPAAEKVRVACIGDSITYGLGVEDRDHDHYPAQLGRLLGPGYDVRNFGVSGATLLRRSKYPYWDVPEFEAAIAFRPDIVVIMLGTNDAKTPNAKNRGEFADDLRAMIDLVAALPSRPRIWVCLPPPVFGILTSFSFPALRNEIIPQIRQVAEEKEAGVIDVFSALASQSDLLPDGVHPNAEGAAVIAETVYKALASEQTEAP